MDSLPATWRSHGELAVPPSMTCERGKSEGGGQRGLDGRGQKAAWLDRGPSVGSRAGRKPHRQARAFRLDSRRTHPCLKARPAPGTVPRTRTKPCTRSEAPRAAGKAICKLLALDPRRQLLATPS